MRKMVTPERKAFLLIADFKAVRAMSFLSFIKIIIYVPLLYSDLPVLKHRSVEAIASIILDF